MLIIFVYVYSNIKLQQVNNEISIINSLAELNFKSIRDNRYEYADKTVGYRLEDEK